MQLPKIYEQDNIENKIVFRIYYGYAGRKSLWFILEGDESSYFAWGGFFDDFDLAEYGYISISDLKNPLRFDEFILKEPLELEKLKHLIFDLKSWEVFRDSELVDIM